MGCIVKRETPTETGLTQLRTVNALIDLVTIGNELGRIGGDTTTEYGNNLAYFCIRLKPVKVIVIKRHLSAFGIKEIDFQPRYSAKGSGKYIYINDPEGSTIELRF